MMKVFHVMLEIGVDDSISAEILQKRVSDAIQEDIPEMKVFRINEVRAVKTASGQFKLSLDEAKRLGMDKPK